MALTATGLALPTVARPPAASNPATFDFVEIEHGVDETHHVAPDHDADILIRWGDPVTRQMRLAFDPENQTAAAQAKQFGYNNDFIGFHARFPFGSELNDRALLCVNHEFTNDNLMHSVFDGVENPLTVYSQEIAEISMAAHGGSVLEITRDSDGTMAGRRRQSRSTAGSPPPQRRWRFLDPPPVIRACKPAATLPVAR